MSCRACALLIRRAALSGEGLHDVRIERGKISQIGHLPALDGEALLDAGGGVLLPGLHDHHIHVAALAASLVSVRCGPPEVTDLDAFAACLDKPGSDWLRATGYHESVAGMLDAAALDRIVPDRPVRVQHRSGRMWFINSAGLEKLLAHSAPPAGLERAGDRYTGRLFDEDAWLKRALRSKPPSFLQVGNLLARAGVTGLTDMSPANDPLMARHFAAEMASRALPQQVLLAGDLSLSEDDMKGPMQLGPAKLHLHEAHLPPLEEATAFVRRAHDRGRFVAVHCATEVELIYALAAIDDAGAELGDRIEHASVTPDLALAEVSRLRLAVAAQPQFVHERGDHYRADMDQSTWPHLYRLRAFLDAQVSLAGGSDAPFASPDPWAAMAAAVSRRTREGALIGESEALTPEQALDLYLVEPGDFRRRRRVALGTQADLCLLDRPWSQARAALSAAYVSACFIRGELVFDRQRTS